MSPDGGITPDDEGGRTRTTMRFTVIERGPDQVFLVSEEPDTIYAHPAVSEAVWRAALVDVPDGWEIVDLCPLTRPSVAPADPGDGRAAHPAFARDAVQEPARDAREAEARREYDEFARGKHDLFCSFLAAGFERDEALALVLGLLHPGGTEEPE
ncbi:MAG: hypothetical protein KDB35_02200 [Acidimicrobiales bacterium]|nr:hypothetical protein [Acidimicrobiales bacterium]MCB1015152.1 hypothetical protein [Acidimicrobiales bacterium]MCB9373026.1 hypothetical protein [Microthrixaceae bacterium]